MDIPCNAKREKRLFCFPELFVKQRMGILMNILHSPLCCEELASFCCEITLHLLLDESVIEMKFEMLPGTNRSEL